MTQEAIGKFIAANREKQKLTQAMLAGRLGVSNGAVASWEEGHSTPNADIIEPLCRVLDVQVSELLAGKNLKDDEKIERGEKSAGTVLAVKAALKVLNVLAIVLIILGAVVVVTVWRFNVQFGEKAVPALMGLGVAGLGIALVVLFGKLKARLEKE
ncbi:MAG: helix-turn-helix transcriptional regulator [Lachnospiraceae bacterium]|nr:helix-turn-helix transcriptional regulator [Lachnospiraceae bacterium]